MWNILKTVKKGHYLYAVVPDHPKAIRFGYVLLHRVIVENSIGRLLLDSEVVHHINGDKKDNRIENLTVLDAGDHVRLHSLEFGRRMIEYRCPWCGTMFVKRASLLPHKDRNRTMCCSRKCRGSYHRQLQLGRKTEALERASSANRARCFFVCRRNSHHDSQTQPDAKQETQATTAI